MREATGARPGQRPSNIPFTIHNAIQRHNHVYVLLYHHFHCIWTLPLLIIVNYSYITTGVGAQEGVRGGEVHSGPSEVCTSAREILKETPEAIRP